MQDAEAQRATWEAQRLAKAAAAADAERMMSAMMDDELGSEAEPQLATGDDAATCSTELQPEEELQSSDDSEDEAEEQEIAEDDGGGDLEEEQEEEEQEEVVEHVS
eukprot:SAG31_NODE_32413_length_356_cov_0.801556_1_plen_105_part_01